MTTIDESLTAKGFTPAASVPQVFGRPRTIDGIVIHHWGALGQNHDGVVNFFVNGPGTTSAHFVASEGRINCLVNPADAAWHSGNAVGNATTIGIECRPEATDGDYATVAELVAYLRSTYGPLPLSPHRQWQSTACPGVWDLARIDQLAGGATIATQGTTTTPAEGFLMALNDEAQENIYRAIGRIDQKLNQSPSAGLLSCQGDINIVLAAISNLAATLKEAAGKEPAAVLVKGDKLPEVYAWDGGSGYRILDYAEFSTLMASGAELRVVKQETITEGGK